MTDILPGKAKLHPGADDLLKKLGGGLKPGERDEFFARINALPVKTVKGKIPANDASVSESLQGAGKAAAVTIRMIGDPSSVKKAYPKSFDGLPPWVTQKLSGEGYHTFATPDAEQWGGESLSSESVAEEVGGKYVRAIKALLVPIDGQRSVLTVTMPMFDDGRQKHDRNSRRGQQSFTLVLEKNQANAVFQQLEQDPGATLAGLVNDINPALADQFDFPAGKEIEVLLTSLPDIQASAAAKTGEARGLFKRLFGG